MDRLLPSPNLGHICLKGPEYAQSRVLLGAWQCNNDTVPAWQWLHEQDVSLVLSEYRSVTNEKTLAPVLSDLMEQRLWAFVEV